MSDKTADPRSIRDSEPNLAAFVKLFSFGTLARAGQFVVPLIIYSFLPASKSIDFYFYWSSQSTLVANFLAAIWPTVMMSSIVRAKIQGGEDAAIRLSAWLLQRFFVISVLVALVTTLLAVNNYLGGPHLDNQNQPLLLCGLFFTILCSSLAIAISEIATAHRMFGLAYQSLLASALVQVMVLALLRSEAALLLSYLLGSFTQLAVCYYMIGKRLNFSNAAGTFGQLPSKRAILLTYTGNLFTLLTAHISYRILGDDQTGAVAAFAMASMLALAPQLLFIQPLSTVAAVAMTETFHNDPPNFERISANWRNRLFRSSLLLGFALAICSWSAYTISPYLSWARDSWMLVLYIMIFLSIPLAASGLSTWLSRFLISIEKIESGVCYQIAFNSFTILILLACSRNVLPFSTPLALAIAAAMQIVSIPVFLRMISPFR